MLVNKRHEDVHFVKKKFLTNREESRVLPVKGIHLQKLCLQNFCTKVTAKDCMWCHFIAGDVCLAKRWKDALPIFPWPLLRRLFFFKLADPQNVPGNVFKAAFGIIHRSLVYKVIISIE